MDTQDLGLVSDEKRALQPHEEVNELTQWEIKNGIAQAGNLGEDSD